MSNNISLFNYWNLKLMNLLFPRALNIRYAKMDKIKS